jgi:hypothetical protein
MRNFLHAPNLLQIQSALGSPPASRRARLADAQAARQSTAVLPVQPLGYFQNDGRRPQPGQSLNCRMSHRQARRSEQVGRQKSRSRTYTCSRLSPAAKLLRNLHYDVHCQKYKRLRGSSIKLGFRNINLNSLEKIASSHNEKWLSMTARTPDDQPEERTATPIRWSAATAMLESSPTRPALGRCSSGREFARRGRDGR